MQQFDKNNTKLVVLFGNTPHSKLFYEAPLFRKKVIVRARKVEVVENLDTVIANGIIETSREVPTGHWIITNPGGEEYAISDEKFHSRYEPLGDGQYRAKGLIRAYPNPTGHAVRINAPWGEPQYGDIYCWFASAVDENLEVTDDRYIIGDDELAETYEPGDKE